MRDVMEDILISLAVLLLLPAVIAAILFGGVFLVIALPWLIAAWLIWVLIAAVFPKAGPTVSKAVRYSGKLIILTFTPTVVVRGKKVNIWQLLFSVVFSIVVVVGLGYVMLFILPPGISALLFWCMVGYAAGKRIAERRK